MRAEKSTIWCLHGAVGSAADWLPFRETWERAGYAVRAVDLWRFLDCCPRSLADTATALNAEVASNEGENLLVGYSMGGRIGLHALLAENSPWNAAVIIGAHPGLESERERIERRQKDADWSVKCHRGEWQMFLQEWQAQPVLQGAGDGVVEWCDRAPLHLRRKEIARSFLEWSLGAQESLWPRLGEIGVPVLWLTGALDGKFTELAERACGLLPRAQRRVTAAAGHRLPWQRPEEFSRDVLEFFRG